MQSITPALCNKGLTYMAQWYFGRGMEQEAKIKDIEINGKVYPMWQQFVQRKEEWIGGVLEDFGDSMDRCMGIGKSSTEILDITLSENGEDSAMFSVKGDEFTCGSDVSCLGLTTGDKGWITLGGYGGHTWRIKQKSKETKQ